MQTRGNYGAMVTAKNWLKNLCPLFSTIEAVQGNQLMTSGIVRCCSAISSTMVYNKFTELKNHCGTDWDKPLIKRYIPSSKAWSRGFRLRSRLKLATGIRVQSACGTRLLVITTRLRLIWLLLSSSMDTSPDTDKLGRVLLNLRKQ